MVRGRSGCLGTLREGSLIAILKGVPTSGSRRVTKLILMRNFSEVRNVMRNF
jgi:hypothetical protein